VASIFGLHRPDYRNSRVFSGKSESRQEQTFTEPIIENV